MGRGDSTSRGKGKYPSVRDRCPLVPCPLWECLRIELLGVLGERVGW